MVCKLTIQLIWLVLMMPGAFAQHSIEEIQVNKGDEMVSIIFDTDIAGDYDDVGAMALLHAFADKGAARILAVISCNAFETTVPTISVLNTYFGRPEIPVGITRRKKPYQSCPQKWAEAIIATYPHRLTANQQATEAVSLYRRLLAQEPDQSVTIVSVGFFTNLADLLASAPDQYSALNGRALVRQKVKQLVSMAASLPKGKTTGREYNVYIDTRASRQVFEQWDTPVILSPLEVGEQIHTGIPLVQNESIRSSPVKDAYAIALAKDSNTVGRMSWDQTAVLVAVKGPSPWFTYRQLNFRIGKDGSNTLIPGQKFTFLELTGSRQELTAEIEKLMQHQPVVK